jgi:excisionase family DNA binding protein
VPDSNSCLLSIPQVSELLGISPKTLRRFIAKRQINYLRIGNQYRFRPTAVELFLSQREVKVGR